MCVIPKNSIEAESKLYQDLHERYISAGYCPSINSYSGWCECRSHHEGLHRRTSNWNSEPGTEAITYYWSDENNTPRRLGSIGL